MSCTTLPSPEQSSSPLVLFISIFNIYAYLNLIFKDRKAKKGAPGSWVLPSISMWGNPPSSIPGLGGNW